MRILACQTSPDDALKRLASEMLAMPASVEPAAWNRVKTLAHATAFSAPLDDGRTVTVKSVQIGPGLNGEAILDSIAVFKNHGTQDKPSISTDSINLRPLWLRFASANQLTPEAFASRLETVTVIGRKDLDQTGLFETSQRPEETAHYRITQQAARVLFARVKEMDNPPGEDICEAYVTGEGSNWTINFTSSNRVTVEQRPLASADVPMMPLIYALSRTTVGNQIIEITRPMFSHTIGLGDPTQAMRAIAAIASLKKLCDEKVS